MQTTRGPVAARKTKVLLDVKTTAGRPSGIPRYATLLAQALPAADRSRAYAYFNWPSRFRRWRAAAPAGFTGAPGVPYVGCPVPKRVLDVLDGRIGLAPPRALVRSPDILHSFTFIPPVFRSVATIATVHDVAFLEHPEVCDSAWVAEVTAGLAHTLPRCAAVLTVSHAAKSEIVNRLGCPAERVAVVYPWPSESLTQAVEAADLPRDHRPYILSVSAPQARKNYHTALEAFALLASRLPHAYLIAGSTEVDPAYTVQLRRRAAELGLADRLQLLGVVDDRVLASLYHRADLLLFPSVHEGFGYPLAEAMAFGTPIVTSNTGSMPEVAGDAALLVPPTSVALMAEAIEAALTDGAVRGRLLAAGIRQRQRFTREHAVTGILAVYTALEHPHARNEHLQAPAPGRTAPTEPIPQ